MTGWAAVQRALLSSMAFWKNALWGVGPFKQMLLGACFFPFGGKPIATGLGADSRFLITEMWSNWVWVLRCLDLKCLMVICWYWNDRPMGQVQSSPCPFSCASVPPVSQARLYYCASSDGRALSIIGCWHWGEPRTPSSNKDTTTFPFNFPMSG